MTEPFPPRFYCAEHGPTNEVIGLFERTRCLACLEHLLDHSEQGVFLAQAFDIRQMAKEAAT
jgi:hypothetical protein